jgi:dipeptidyl aminopeptidase/acylaminoacyl peptidase
VLSPRIFERGFSSLENPGRQDILLLDPVSGKTVNRLAPPTKGRIAGLSWDNARGELRATVSGRNAAAKRTYRLAGSAWRQISATAGTGEPPCSIEVPQSVNSRPRLTARCVGDREATTLLDPNEWLDARQVGRVEPVTWEAGGRTWRGGIIYPPNFDASRRYPLVIQTHGFRDGVFSLSGVSDNYPGHALAAHDIVVLEVSENEFASGALPQVVGKPASWENARTGYEGAIDYLSSRGIVDRNRVGMIGWSATGSYVGYMTTHSEYRIKAAAFTDTLVFGWSPYILKDASQPYEDIFGGPPFGAGLEAWIETSPAFNLDRVRTPYLIWGAEGTMGYAEWYHLLRRLKSPVEAWLFTKGSHHMYREPARVHSVKLLIDWFRFWLTGERDADSKKSEQYARWELLYQQQIELARVQRRPLLDWAATPREQ